MTFLSEENIKAHRGYVENLRLKYSIMEKSIDGLKNLNIRDILRQNMKKEDKRDATLLLGEILAHERFFSSFTRESYVRSPAVEKRWGTVAEFLNCFYRAALGNLYGYTALTYESGRLCVRSVDFGCELFQSGEPLLILDVCEHTFFADYGFDKERFLYRCIPFLNLSRVDDFLGAKE